MTVPVRAVCALQPMEIYVDDEAKLTLHGLVQHYIMLNEEEKNRKLNDLLDALDFNQVHLLCLACTSSGNLRCCCVLRAFRRRHHFKEVFVHCPGVIHGPVLGQAGPRI